MYEQPITIAGLTINLSSALSPAALGIVERLGEFFGPASPAGPQVTLRWEGSADAPVAQGKLVYDPGALWRLFRHGDTYEAQVRYTEDLAAVLRVNATWDEATLVEHRQNGRRPSQLATGVGELLVRTSLLRHGGLVLHSAAIDDGGRGIVFVGHSGAGKSTQCAIWSRETGAFVMNEDRVAIRLEGEGARCYGTPWGNLSGIAHNHAAPLAALVMVVQAPENRVEIIPPSQAAPLLMARAFMPYWDPALVALASANLDALVRRVPVLRLRCRAEPAVVELVRARL